MANTGFAQVDGLQIYYEQHGAGSALILVHGWGADTKSNWRDTGWISLLAQHRTVVSIDVRGHGKSDKPHALAPYSYAAMSADVIAVMDALNIDRADFMGYSMGSFMGAYLLGHHPTRFTSMVLGGIGDETESSAAQGGAIAKALRASDVNNIDSAVGKSVRRYVEKNPDNDLQALAFSAEKMWPEGYPLKVAGENIHLALLPVLIINGENDHPYVDSADSLSEALPNATHVVIPGVDHLSALANEKFRHAVVAFLLKH